MGVCGGGGLRAELLVAPWNPALCTRISQCHGPGCALVTPTAQGSRPEALERLMWPWVCPPTPTPWVTWFPYSHLLLHEVPNTPGLFPAFQSSHDSSLCRALRTLLPWPGMLPPTPPDRGSVLLCGLMTHYTFPS